MRYIFFITIIGIFYSQGQAKSQKQPQKVDSLKNVLDKTQLNKQRVDVCNQLAHLFHNTDLKKTNHYALQALNLAYDLKYTEGISSAYYHLGWARMQLGKDNRNSKAYLLQAICYAEQANYTQGKLDAYNGLGAVLMYDKAYDESLKYFQKAAQLLRTVNNPEALAANYCNSANVFMYKGDNNKAIILLEKALEIQKTLGMPEKQAIMHFNLAINYSKLGNHLQALRHYKKALQLQKGQGNIRHKAFMHSHIGRLYHKMGQYDETWHHLTKALALFKRVKSKKWLIKVNINIAKLLIDYEDYPQALEYLQRAKKLIPQAKQEKRLPVIYYCQAFIYLKTKKIKRAETLIRKYLRDTSMSSWQISSLYNLLGKVYLARKQYTLARDYAAKSVALRSSKQSKANRHSPHNTLGAALYHLGKPEQALAQYNKVTILGEGVNSPRDYMEAIYGISQCYEALGRSDEALTHYKQYHQLRDSLTNHKNFRKLGQKEMKYALRLQKDSLQKQYAEAQLIIARQAQEKQDKQQYLFLGLLGVFLVTIAIFLFYQNKQKHGKELFAAEQKLWKETQNRIWAEQQKLKNEIELKNQQLTSHTLHMIQKNQALNELRKLVNAVRQQRTMAEAKKMFHKLAQLVDFGLNLDKDWADFQNIFEQLHPEFFKSLQGQFPKLTQGELQLCALIRLNLDNKVIADMQGISINGIRIKRHRIRQKLGLEVADNLLEALVLIEKGEYQVEQPVEVTRAQRA
ncbi:tetratricopeptide repeat protein [Microscilla marina]|uniref:Tetratricopeptide repeat domain protein n=1 Tax=Microscilla marina ATCC 23134 TaxID=313606 RepID=A1ZNQ6_MICM2|nr:tetratricopeptide repeat protein [Microscilla marina]EAY27945.1 tetratricopeptide repeat domain protein [Microscilla marina ATCC 23134]